MPRSTRRHRALVEVPLDHDRLVDADLAFHEEVARASGNPVLAALVVGLAGRASRTRLWRGLSDEGAEERAFVEHEAILAAVAARDPTGRGCGWPPTCSGSRTPRRASGRPER